LSTGFFLLKIPILKHLPSLYGISQKCHFADSTDNEEQTIVAIERAVMLCGGVTRDHIISTLHLWESVLIQASIFFNGRNDLDIEQIN
jgi:hypothetical protein